MEDKAVVNVHIILGGDVEKKGNVTANAWQSTYCSKKILEQMKLQNQFRKLRQDIK